MRNLDELGMQPSDEESRLPPTDKQIRAFEQTFGLKLPTSFIQFLKFFNGGSPEKMGRFAIRDLGQKDGIHVLYHLSDDKKDEESLWRNARDWIGEIGKSPGYVPFGDDGCGNLLVLDCRAEPARVYFADHEQRFELFLVAGSFEEFVDSLKPPEPLPDEEDEAAQ